jgi:farnesyl diphosphate synthase
MRVNICALTHVGQIFKDYEEESYKRLTSLIETHAGSLPHAIFLDFASKIYKRTK